MEILVKEYRRYEKNTLQAFVDLEIVEIGLTIKGCSVHQKGGKAWIGFPGREYADNDGKKQWANLMEFSKERKEEFRDAAVKAVKKHVVSEQAAAPKHSEIPF